VPPALARATRAVLAALLLAALVPLGPVASAQQARAATAAAPTTVTASTPVIVQDDASATVVVQAQGSAEKARTSESRGFAHADLQPTGRFVLAGDTLTFTVPETPTPVGYVISASGVYADLNDGESGASRPPSTDLPAGTSTVTAESDGMVYLVRTGAGEDVLVEVEGGRAQPVFVLGTTTADDLVEQLARWADSRFVIFVGERIYADMQRSQVDAVIVADADWDPEVMVTYWDLVIELANEAHGLRDDAVGVAVKSRPRVRAINPDTGAGWASAKDGVIAFQVDSGAGLTLLQAREGHDDWGLWHEVGHTYQNPEYKWEGMLEVQVNLYSAYIQSRLGMPTRYTSSSTAVRQARELFAQPVEDRARTGASHEVMFEQLRRAFGDAFWARVNQQYRVELATGRATITDDDEKVQHFIRTTSLVADRDLSEFFRQWGMPADATTLAAVADLPALTHELWTELDPDAMPLENLLDAYVVPTGSIGTVEVDLGTTTLADAEDVVQDLGSLGGTSAVHVAGSAVSTRAGLTGTAWVRLENDLGVSEVISASVAVRRGQGLTFRGLTYTGSDDTALTMALAADTGTLRMFSAGRVVHPYFSGTRYFSLELRAADGSTVTSAALDGEETPDDVAAVFDGQPYEDGQHLLTYHREPTRLNVYVDSVLQTSSSVATRAFLIQDGVLVEVDPSEVPEETEAAADPAEPEGPDGPTVPEGSGEAEDPAAPDEAEEPAAPEEAEDPAGADEPAVPDDTEGSAEPVDPAVPDAPSAPEDEGAAPGSAEGATGSAGSTGAGAADAETVEATEATSSDETVAGGTVTSGAGSATSSSGVSGRRATGSSTAPSAAEAGDLLTQDGTTTASADEPTVAPGVQDAPAAGDDGAVLAEEGTDRGLAAEQAAGGAGPVAPLGAAVGALLVVGGLLVVLLRRRASSATRRAGTTD
jgi:hypothetical protein